MAAQTPGIEETFAKMADEFKLSLRDSANTLKLLHDKLSAGLLPSEDMADLALRSLESDRREYAKLHEACRDLLGDGAPAFGASADELLGAVKAKGERERSALAQTREVLARFLRVKTDSPLHAKGLQPWRDKARAVQNQLDARALSPEDMAEQIRPFALFLRASALADMEGEATERVFDDLEEFFEPRISRGLYGGKFHVPAQEDVDADLPADPDIPAAGQAPAATAGQPAAEEVQPVPEAPAQLQATEAPAGQTGQTDQADPEAQDAQALPDAPDASGAPDAPGAPAGEPAAAPARKRRARRKAAEQKAGPDHAPDAGQALPADTGASAAGPAADREPAARAVRGRKPKPRPQAMQGPLMTLAAMEKAGFSVRPEAWARAKAAAGLPEDASSDGASPDGASPDGAGSEDEAKAGEASALPPAADKAPPAPPAAGEAGAMPEEAAAPAPSATPSAATGAPEAAGQASGAAFAPDAGGKALGGGKDDDEDGEGLQLFDVDDDEEEEEDLPLNPESDECVDTRPRLRGFELVKFLNSNAKKHYRIFMRTISLVGIATADQLVRFAQVYGWLKPKHAKKAMGELRILASGGYLKSVRGPVQAFVFPDSSVCALYGCERRAAFANSFDWHNVLDLCCLRDVPDSMPQSRVAIAVDLNERLLRYLEACRSLFDEERWQIFLDSVTYRNFRVEVECFYECPPDSCWIAWPGAPVDEKPRSWLFVPTKEEGLPELASPAFGSGCYAFWEGTWWKWRKGAWENNPAPLPDGRSLQTGTKPAPDAPSAKHASSETPEAESEALARPESQAPEQAQARARAEASSTAKHAGTDADSPAQAHDGSVAPAPDEPLVPESGETVSLAPSRPSRQLGQFLCSNSTRQYRQLLFVLAIFGIATTDQLLRYCTLHGLIKDPVKARRDLGILASRRFIKVVGEGEGKALAYPAQAWHAGELGAGTLGPSEKTGWKRIIPDSVPQSRIDLILALNERFVRLLEQAKPLLGAARFREFFALCALYTFRIEAPALFLDDFVPCRLALPDDPVDSAAASWLFVPTAEEGLPDIVSVAEGGACFACFENAWWKWEEGVWIPDRDSAPTPPDGTAGPGGPDGSGGSGGPQGETKAGTLADPGSRGEAGVKAKADAKGAVASPAAKGAVEASPPRKRGRPRKAKPAEAASRASPAAAPGPVPATKAEIGQTAGAEAAAGVQATDNGEADRADTDASKATPQDTSPGTMQATSQDAAQNAGRKKPKEQARRAAMTYAKKAPPLSMDDFLGKIQRLEATDAACPPPAGEALWETAARLAGQKETPADEEFCRLVERLCAQARSDGADVLASPSLAQALALAEACRLQKLPLCGELAQRLQLATGTALPDAYGSFNLANAFPPEPRLESLALAAYLRALAVSAGDGQDYRLLDRCHLYLNDFDQAFPSYRSLRQLFARLVETRQAEPSGFTPKALAQIEDEEAKSASLEALRQRARDLAAVPAVKMRAHGIPEMLQALFGRTSELGACMEACAQGQAGGVPLVKRVLEAFCDASGEGWKPREKAVSEAVDSAWSQATKNMSTRRFSLFHDLRQSIQEEVEARLEVMAEWLAGAEAMDSGRAERLRGFKYQVLKELDALPRQAGGTDAFACCVDFMLAQLRALLRQRRTPRLFADLLRTGFVSLDSRYKPVFWEETAQIRWFEPWRRVLKHIAHPGATLASALADISGAPDSPVFDNLNQLALIERLQGTAEGGQAFDETARRHAEAGTEEFKARLELDYAAGRVDEADKEDLLQIISSMQERFFALGDFGCWRQLLAAAELERTDRIQARKARLASEIASLRLDAPEPATALDKACRELEQGQFSMAEEFLNVFDLRSRERLEALCNPDMDDAGYYQRFLSQAFFEPAYEYCMRTLKGTGLGKRAIDFLHRLAADPDEWTSRYREDSRLFLQSWPAQGGAKADRLVQFLEGLGIQARRASLQDRFPSEEIWEAEVAPTPPSHPDYPHPIAAFGTRLQSPLRVVVMYGSRTAKALVDTVNALKLQGRFMTVVVLDYALSKDVRCQLAEACHKSSGLSPFIVVDWMLALYLALHQKTERMAALLSCALPYATAVQPFVRDGGPTAEEMFCGRTRELNDILDFGGACLVYGGRQLGKTALLQRAQSRFHAPSSRCYAVYCSIKDKSRENEVVPFLCQEVNKQTDLRLPHSSSLASFCGSLESLFRKQKIQSMLLLLDEADNFLREAGLADYQPLQPLADLKRKVPSFKFVLAGLNNVCRARNATSNNGVFGQLGQPLCIKPLSPAEAMRLILRPLRYLGFTPGPDSHLDTILSSTNYYPGIVQFFGYKLVQSLNEDYSRYYRASEGNPPFPLKGEHLGAIMNNSDMNESIRQKFRLSLELDERYFMLARCICMLYHLQESMDQGFLGYGADQIRTMAEDYGIRCLAGLGTAEYEALLDEMTEMGILHHAPGRGYRLRKRSFLDIIGQDMDRLDAEITEENARSVQP